MIKRTAEWNQNAFTGRHTQLSRLVCPINLANGTPVNPHNVHLHTAAGALRSQGEPSAVTKLSGGKRF